MNSELKNTIDLMAHNFQQLKKAFAWDDQSIKHFGALISATRDYRIDVERIMAVRQTIKDQTSWTSYFRGHNELMLSMLLQNEAGYESLFTNMKQSYDRLKAYGFKSGSYLPLAAYTLTVARSQAPEEEIYRRMEQFYGGMKENHYWLTNQDDYVMVALLALSEKAVVPTLEDMERCYGYLNQSGLYKGSELQSLSHILALGEEETQAKCERALAIYKGLSSRKCKLYHQGLSTLGVLALLGIDPPHIVDEVAEVYDYLEHTQGYGFWGISQILRVILAASIVADFHADQLKQETVRSVVANSVNSILIAQQVATMAAITAATTAASASSSS